MLSVDTYMWGMGGYHLECRQPVWRRIVRKRQKYAVYVTCCDTVMGTTSK